MSYPYLLLTKTLTVFIDGKPLQTDRTNPHWAEIVTALNDENADPSYLTALMTPIHTIASFVADNPKVSVRGASVYYGDEVIHSVLATKILDIAQEGLPLDPWLKFTENCFANPSPFARDELYLFLEKAELPITPDGCFIAYKRVRATSDGTFVDMHSGKIDNSVGQVVIMPGGRPAVDANRNRTCSTGLHFCSKEYLDSFGGDILLLVKINPADVVAIPSDHNDSKGRCWRYEVVSVIDDRRAHTHRWPAISAGIDDTRWGFEETDPELPEVETTVEDDVDDEFEPETETVVQSITLGPVDRARFQALFEQYGSLRAIARGLGMSEGSIQSWKTRLGWVRPS